MGNIADTVFDSSHFFQQVRVKDTKEESMRISRLITTIVIIILSGCATIGPKTVPRDRFDYNTAIADSWKEQTLLNIVKLRYADMPLFVEVASVVSGYTLESGVNINGTLSSRDTIQGDFLALGASGKFTDRPTITYAPITGAKFNQSFMQPIPPKAVLFLLQSGWPADYVLPITLSALNGFRGRVAAGKGYRRGDPEYYRAIALMRKIQKSGAAEMRVITDEKQKETILLFFYRKNIPQDVQDAIESLKKTLGLNPVNDQLTVTYGVLPETDQELAMATRSMLQIMLELSKEVDVPAVHVEEGRTIPTIVQPSPTEEEIGYLAHIQSATEAPEDAFVAVRYKDYWYWIDDRDFISKRTFTFLMVLFSLTETGGKEGLPLVTIPAG